MGAIQQMMAAVGGGVLSTLTHVGTTTSTTNSISIHGSAVAGDLGFLVDGSDNTTSAATKITPSGFFEHIDQTQLSSGNERRLVISSKILSGADITAGSLTCTNGNNNNGKVLYVYRPNVAAAAIAEIDVETGANGNLNPAAISVASGAGNPPLIVIAGKITSGSGKPYVLYNPSVGIGTSISDELNSPSVVYSGARKHWDVGSTPTDAAWDNNGGSSGGNCYGIVAVEIN